MQIVTNFIDLPLGTQNGKSCLNAIALNGIHIVTVGLQISLCVLGRDWSLEK